jgi:hypothetical protein
MEKSLTAKKKFLMGRGYDLRGKDVKHIELLYGMYAQKKKGNSDGKAWSAWRQTNRLHHYG